jgi:hypothetical protein
MVRSRPIVEFTNFERPQLTVFLCRQFNNFPSPQLPSEQAAIRATNARLGERKDSINFIELPVTIKL